MQNPGYPESFLERSWQNCALWTILVYYKVKWLLLYNSNHITYLLLNVYGCFWDWQNFVDFLETFFE